MLLWKCIYFGTKSHQGAMSSILHSQCSVSEKQQFSQCPFCFTFPLLTDTPPQSCFTLQNTSQVLNLPLRRTWMKSNGGKKSGPNCLHIPAEISVVCVRNRFIFGSWVHVIFKLPLHSVSACVEWLKYMICSRPFAICSSPFFSNHCFYKCFCVECFTDFTIKQCTHLTVIEEKTHCGNNSTQSTPADETNTQWEKEHGGGVR